MSDIVERLVAYRPTNEWGDGVHHVICTEASAEVTRLRGEVERLRELGKFTRHNGLCAIIGGYGYCTCGLDAARSALGDG